MGLREDRFERVSELFYEAAGVPETWPDALDALAEHVGGHLAPPQPAAPAVEPARIAAAAARIAMTMFW